MISENIAKVKEFVTFFRRLGSVISKNVLILQAYNVTKCGFALLNK